jgi:predicted nucleic acid-binding protein
MILLDTNIVSEADKPMPNEQVSRWYADQDRQSLFICGPVVMELSYGAEAFFVRTGSQRYLNILRTLLKDRFRDRILKFDGDSPAISGRFRAMRERMGHPISIPDAMIAAICLSHDATLATRNVRDFDGLDLKLVNPFEQAV